MVSRVVTILILRVHQHELRGGHDGNNVGALYIDPIENVSLQTMRDITWLANTMATHVLYKHTCQMQWTSCIPYSGVVSIRPITWLGTVTPRMTKLQHAFRRHYRVWLSLVQLFSRSIPSFAFLRVLLLRSWKRNDSRISYLVCILESIGVPCTKTLLEIFIHQIKCELDKVWIFGVSRSICFELDGGGWLFLML